MKNIKILFSGVLAAVALAGCADFGSTEPVLNTQPTAFRSNEQPAAAPVYRQQADNTSKREIAAFRADLDAVAEQQKMLTARIMGLEEQLSQKEKQIKELQSLLDAMDKRFADVDSNWRNRMQELSSNIDKEREARKREQKQFTQAVTKVIADQSNAASDNTEYIEFVVQKGDTLSKIASAAKVSIAEIKRINNLKNDVIREGQKLKLPKK